MWWPVGKPVSSTQTVALQKVYQHRQQLARLIFASYQPYLQTPGGHWKETLRSFRRRLLSDSTALPAAASTNGGINFNSTAFVASIGNSTGLQALIGQFSLQVLRLNNIATKPSFPSVFSTILAGNLRLSHRTTS